MSKATAAAQQQTERPAFPTPIRGSTLPARICIYGPEGVGKSLLASSIGRAIMIDCEDGAQHCEVDRFQFPDGRTKPETLEEIDYARRALLAAEHDYDTLIIDGLDTLERLLHGYICRTFANEKTGQLPKNIEGYGWQRGYKIAVTVWRELCSKLETLRRDRRMRIVMVGHAQTEVYQNPMGDDFDQFGLMLHKRAAGFLYGWFDVVGFLNFESTIAKTAGGKQVGQATGARVLHLQSSAGYIAKARTAKPLTSGSVVIPETNGWAVVQAALKGEEK